MLKHLGMLVLLCHAGSFSLAGVRLDRPPERDADTLLIVRFDEPDEGVLIGEKLMIDPIFVGRVARHQQGRFGGALTFVGRPGARQCMLIPLPQRLEHVRHTSRKDPSVFAELDVPVVLMDNPRGYTIELWVLAQALQRQTVVAGINTGTMVPRPSWEVGLTADGNVRFACGSGLHRFSTTSNRTVPIGEWTHVAVVCEKGSVQIHLNGTAAGEARPMKRAAAQRIAQPGSDGTTICIGGPGPAAGGGSFDGRIDELRLSSAPRTFVPDPAVMIGGRKELFLDDHLVASTAGVRRVVHPPKRCDRNPLLRAQGDWDARIIQPMGTVHDPRVGLFRTWYRAFNRANTEANMCYAFSRDGLHWEQPVLGLAEYKGSKRNNIVARHRSCFMFLDPLARPGEGNVCATAKMQYGSRHGTFKQVLMRSPDGLQWPWGKVEGTSGYQGYPYSRVRRMEAIMATDRPLIIDPTYFAKIDKLVVIDKEGESDATKFKQFARIGWALTCWQDPYLTGLKATQKNDQGWYGIKTHDEESVLVGITDAYHGKRPDRWIDFQLICSRDGYHWQHVVDQETFFPIGREGSWDAGMVLYAQLVAPPGSDRIYLYYTGSRLRHDRVDDAKPEELPVYNLGVAFLRRDGYVSLKRDGSADVGVVTTRPIRFRGRRLFVNADASKGSIQVELCDATGKALAGHGRAACKPLTADALRHPVRWGDVTDVSALAGRAVVVRFYLRGEAELYSYRFADPDPHGRRESGPSSEGRR